MYAQRSTLYMTFPGISVMNSPSPQKTTTLKK